MATKIPRLFRFCYSRMIELPCRVWSHRGGRCFQSADSKSPWLCKTFVLRGVWIVQDFSLLHGCCRPTASRIANGLSGLVSLFSWNSLGCQKGRLRKPVIVKGMEGLRYLGSSRCFNFLLGLETHDFQDGKVLSDMFLYFLRIFPSLQRTGFESL